MTFIWLGDSVLIVHELVDLLISPSTIIPYSLQENYDRLITQGMIQTL